jgi:hypothetical protein
MAMILWATRDADPDSVGDVWIWSKRPIYKDAIWDAETRDDSGREIPADWFTYLTGVEVQPGQCVLMTPKRPPSCK